MKRDFDLVRKLLLYFEVKDSPEHVLVPAIESYDEMTIKQHLVLVYEAGLLRCEVVRSSTSDRVIYVIPFELTWNGHEFLETIRSEKLWAKVRDALTSKAGALTFGLINQLANKHLSDLID